MNDTKMLIGSLSNDLFRVATLTQRGSNVAAERFLIEAKKWASQLNDHTTAPHIAAIAKSITAENDRTISQAKAEKCLMYGVLLQNYALHHD